MFVFILRLLLLSSLDHNASFSCGQQFCRNLIMAKVEKCDCCKLSPKWAISITYIYIYMLSPKWTISITYICMLSPK